MVALPKSSALGQSTKSLPRNTVLLIGSNLWARLSPSKGNVDLVLHVEGPEAEDVVVVRDEAVLSLVLGQKMTIKQQW